MEIRDINDFKNLEVLGMSTVENDQPEVQGPYDKQAYAFKID